MFDKPIIQTTNSNKKIEVTSNVISRTIYYGEVISTDDSTESGNIQVNIPGLDNGIANSDLVWCYPLLPKFFHIYPKKGEMVRVFIEDIKYPQRSRFWIGSIIGQLQNIKIDSSLTALSTTNMGLTKPLPAISTYKDSEGVFPQKDDVALIGRVNTDVILRTNEVHIRAGKHENDNVVKLNINNPATVTLTFESKNETDSFYSNTVVMSDKIALISHSGNPDFKKAQLTPSDREKIFETAHPIPRGDVLVEALNLMRNVIVSHIHGYSNLPADKDTLIKDLEKINFEAILQKNIVIN